MYKIIKLQLERALRQLVILLTMKKELLLEEKRRIVLKYAISCLGKDVAPTQDELGCAEAVNYIVNKATGEPIGGGLSTYLMYQELKMSHRRVYTPEKGNVIISPTGFGKKGTHGHVGIMLDDTTIMSNNSYTGLWETKYTVESWYEKYTVKMGYPTYQFKLYK